MSVPPKILGLSNGYNVSFNVSFKTNQWICIGYIYLIFSYPCGKSFEQKKR